MGTAAAPATTPKKFLIDRSSRVPLYTQLHEQLRKDIQTGVFTPGQTLPTIPDFSIAYDVSRTTIRRALHELVMNGLVEGSSSSGYRVASAKTSSSAPTNVKPFTVEPRPNPVRPGLAQVIRPETAAGIRPEPAPLAREMTPVRPEPAPAPRPEITPFRPEPVNKIESVARPAPIEPPKTVSPVTKVAEPEPKPVEVKRMPSPNGVVLAPPAFNRFSILEQIDFAKLQSAGAPRPFRPGFPDTQEFPLEIWEGLRAHLLRERTAELLDFSGTFGHMPLRQAIAARLRNSRGLKCSAEQIIVCAGAQQALNLVINTLVSPGDVVGLEEPGYYGVKAAMLQAGARVTPLLVDDEGLIVPESRKQKPPLLIYTTPANQFPLGSALTLTRRLALLEHVRQTNTWILEDDSDGDFSYSGRPIPSLQGADAQNRVIYLGTTGKTLFPSLEIGYIVAPLSLMEGFSKTKEIMGGHPSVIDQATLAHFLGEGHFDRHLQRMNVVYYQRMQALADSVNGELNGYIDLQPATAGLHAVGWLARGLDEQVVANSAAGAGIELPLLSSYGRTALVRPGVVFGFASFGERKIRETVQKLAQALKSPPTASYTAPAPRALPPAPNFLPEPARPGFFQRLFSNGSRRT